MSDASGLGLLDVAILQACADVRAVSRGPYVKTLRVLGALRDRTGIGPRVAYGSLCDLGRPWVVHLQLLDVHGNIGSLAGFPAADPEFTECRLTPLGEAVLAAEAGALGRLPVGLINGDTHAGGARPPLDPRRAVAAIRAASALDDAELLDALGRPAFPTGCDVEVDLRRWASGAPVEALVTARIESDGPGRFVISCLPPDVAADVVVDAIVTREQLGRGRDGGVPMIWDVRDESTADRATVVVESRAGVDGDALADALAELPCIRHPMTFEAGVSVTDAIRAFGDPDRDALEHRLALVAAAIR